MLKKDDFKQNWSFRQLLDLTIRQTEKTWNTDFVEHLFYPKNFTILSNRLPFEPQTGFGISQRWENKNFNFIRGWKKRKVSICIERPMYNGHSCKQLWRLVKSFGRNRQIDRQTQPKCGTLNLASYRHLADFAGFHEKLLQNVTTIIRKYTIYKYDIMSYEIYIYER